MRTRWRARALPSTMELTASKVARIRRQADADLAIGQLADAFVAEVVFHVAIAGDRVRLVVRREFVEHRGERLPNEIREDVQPPAVGHAHFDLLHAVRRAGFEDRVEDDHRALAAFVGEALFPEEPLAEEIFERLRFEHPAQRVELFRRSVLGRAARGLSIRSRTQWRTVVLWMCMNSKPILSE